MWVIGNTPGTKVYDRFTLTLSVSQDGLAFDRHFVVRDRSSLLPTRYAGGGKNPGFACKSSKCAVTLAVSLSERACHADPSGMWKNDTMLIAYSESKENISITRFPIASIAGATA